MDQGLLDASKIPKFQFQLHNQQLTNCIKQLYFQFKTQQKKIDKIRKDMEVKVQENVLSDLFIQLISSIEIHPTLLKQLPSRIQPKITENQLKNNSNKFGYKIGQVNDVMKLLSDRLKNLQRRLQLSQTQIKQQINEKTQTLQNQFDQSKRSQNKQNRNLNESIVLTHGKYQQKLKQIESKTLWQINNCKMQLNQKVTQQYVKDYTKQVEVKIMNKIKQSLIKGSVDPQVIDNIQIKANKLEKQLQFKIVELNARINEVKDNIELNLPNRKEINQQKIQNQKKIGNLQVLVAEATRRIKNIEQENENTVSDVKTSNQKIQIISNEISRLNKMVSNLRLSDDFMKLMENLDPHKICNMDTSINSLNQKDLKIEKQIDSLKRYIQKFREKVQICNLLTPNQNGGKIDKEELNKLLQEVIGANSTFKKIPVIEGQLYQFKSYGEMINEINKRISKIQKQFDIQGVIYGLRGLEQFIKKQILIMNTKISQLQSQLNDEKRRRPLSAKKSVQTKISSSVSFKRLVPVDCISCFQNPIGDRTPERVSYSGKRI